MGQRLSKHPDQGLEAGLVEATAMPTGGASALADTVYHVFHDDMKPDDAQSLLTQGAVGQVASAGLGVGLSKATGSGWTGRGPAADPASDQAMIDNLTRERVGRGASGRATLAQGKDAMSGRLTSVTESDSNNGRPAELEQHAERRAQREVGPIGGRTVAVDQQPCGSCTDSFQGQELTGSARVIVPRNPLKPNGSIKSAAVDAAKGKANVGPEEVLRVPFQPPIHPAVPQSDNDDQ